jgi:hypothetical protein
MDNILAIIKEATESLRDYLSIHSKLGRRRFRLLLFNH